MSPTLVEQVFSTLGMPCNILVQSSHDTPHPLYKLLATCVYFLNNSPVASMLPVVTLYQDETASFSIPASDNEGQTLKYPSWPHIYSITSLTSDTQRYSLASPADMGTSTSVHPSQLSVSPSGTLTFNANGVALGLWTTQVKVSDGLAYVVVDFVIAVVVFTQFFSFLIPILFSFFALFFLSPFFSSSSWTSRLIYRRFVRYSHPAWPML